MKTQILLPITIALTVALFGLTKFRLKYVINEEKRARFFDVKLRVTGEVLSEYEKEKQDTDSLMLKAKNQQDVLEKAISALQAGGKKRELESCQDGKTKTKEEIPTLEQQLQTLQADTAKEKSDWEAEAAALKQTLSAPSPICNYIKSGSQAQNLCPEKKEEPKPEEKKAEEPKPEEKKAEEPKPEEKKAEEPKPEEKKAEEPKPEEKKAEEPKPEEKKAEEPKPEEKKAEEPKQ